MIAQCGGIRRMAGQQGGQRVEPGVRVSDRLVGMWAQVEPESRKQINIGGLRHLHARQRLCHEGASRIVEGTVVRRGSV